MKSGRGTSCSKQSSSTPGQTTRSLRSDPSYSLAKPIGPEAPPSPLGQCTGLFATPDRVPRALQEHDCSNFHDVQGIELRNPVREVLDILPLCAEDDSRAEKRQYVRSYTTCWPCSTRRSAFR